MEASFREPWVVHPTLPHTHTFIILHGRGDSGEMFGRGFLGSMTASGLTLPEIFPGMKFICPTAKKGPSARLNGRTLNQWFDIYSLEDPSEREEVQVEGLQETIQFLHNLILREMESVPSRNIILGGLSQGCAAAIPALMTLDLTLGAFVGMSGWLPFGKHLEEIINAPPGGLPVGISGSEGGEDRPSAPVQAINSLRKNINLKPLESTTHATPPLPFQTPVLLGHGEIDETVNIRLGRQIYEVTTALGMDVRFKEYEDYGHWYLVPEEIDDIADFLNEKVGITRAEL